MIKIGVEMIMSNTWQKNIILFLLSQTMSLFGTSLVQYAIMWYITLNTKSGIMMAVSIICSFIPTFILSPFAGVWADRYSKKKLIMLSDSFIALSTLVLAVLFLIGYDSIVLLFILSSLRAIGTGIQTPSVNSFIPQIVPENQLVRVNGIFSGIQAAIMLLAPMLSGVLIANTTFESILFIDVFTAAIAVFVLFSFLNIPNNAKTQNVQESTYFEDMAGCIKYIKKNAYLSKLFVLYSITLFLVTPVCFLTPLQVTRSFGDDVWRLTAIEVAFAFGMILGSVAIASFAGFKNRIYTMALASFIFGVCTFFLGILSIFWVYIIIMSMAGITLPFFNTPMTVILQEKVEVDYHGRIFGVLNMISSSMMPMGMFVFGPMADMIPVEWLLLGTGLLIFIQSFFFIASKDLVIAGREKGCYKELLD